jgi:hypothetical protein
MGGEHVRQGGAEIAAKFLGIAVRVELRIDGKAIAKR